MRFKISCEIWNKCHIKVLKHLLLPNCCQEKIRPKIINFRFSEIKCLASLLFPFQFTVDISHGFGNSQILELTSLI